MEPENNLKWQFPIVPSTNRGQATHLSASADGKRIAYGTMKSVVIREVEVPEKANKGYLWKCEEFRCPQREHYGRPLREEVREDCFRR